MPDVPFLVATIVGFVPSFGILYFAWGKLEGLFNEKQMFWNYFLGWIMGVFIAVFFLILKYSVGAYLDLSLMFLVFFAIFTESLKYIYLNIPKKRKNYQLPYQGFALGLGISALWAVAVIYQYLRYANLNDAQYIIGIISFFLFSTGIAAIHASTGAMMGYGIFNREGERFLLKSMGIMIIFNLTLLPLVWEMNPVYYIFGFSIGIPHLYFKVYKGVLVNVIPQEVKSKWQRERKKVRGE